MLADGPRTTAPWAEQAAFLRLRRGARAAAVAVGAFLVLLAGLFAGLGWVYVLRGMGWFAAGPSIGDSLPLLQLASFDAQPLARVVMAWLLAGVLVGLALSRLSRRRRALIALVGALLLLALDSQASYALTRNLNFEAILFSRAPGLGPLVEAVAFALGATLRRQARGGSLGERGLRGGEHGDAAKHQGDRGQVA